MCTPKVMSSSSYRIVMQKEKPIKMDYPWCEEMTFKNLSEENLKPVEAIKTCMINYPLVLILV